MNDPRYPHMGQVPSAHYQAQASQEMSAEGPRDPRQSPGVWYIEAGGRARVEHFDFSQYTQVPAIYRVQVTLPHAAGARQDDSTTLRPEMFLLKRITWASVFPSLELDSGAWNFEGRTITTLWSDEFTSFLGRDPIMLSALFGDSNGYLDLTREVLFQGKQTLSATLNRLVQFGPGEDASIVQLVFHGTGLLPPGMHASGGL